MDWAHRVAQESYCKRLKVGCVIATYDLKDVLSYGYNGTLSGFPNDCENQDGSTNNNIIVHAEQNALDKITASNKSAKGSAVFITVSPCVNCAIRLINVGVRIVYFAEDYINVQGELDTSGIQLLQEAGISIKQVLTLDGHPTQLYNTDIEYQIRNPKTKEDGI